MTKWDQLERLFKLSVDKFGDVPDLVGILFRIYLSIGFQAAIAQKSSSSYPFSPTFLMPITVSSRGRPFRTAIRQLLGR